MSLVFLLLFLAIKKVSISGESSGGELHDVNAFRDDIPSSERDRGGGGGESKVNGEI